MWSVNLLVAHHRLKISAKLESSDMVFWLSSPVAEATDGGFKCFIGVEVNVSGLVGPACCWLSMKEGSWLPSGLLLLSFADHLAMLSGLDDYVSGLPKLYSLAAGAGCCDC